MDKVNRRSAIKMAAATGMVAVIGPAARSAEPGSKGLLPVLTTSEAQPTAISVPDLTARSHHIAFPPSVGGTLKPGVVVDMSRSPFILKESLRLDCKADPIVPISQHVVAVVTRQDNSTTSRQVAFSVEASLSVFGGGRVGISNDEFDSIRQNSVYARLCTIDGVQVLGERPQWPQKWKLPDADNDRDKLKAFVDEYGTHYVEKLFHGRTISIKATMREERKERKDELEAKLRARLWTFSLDAEYVKRVKEELASYQFDLLISIQGGKADKPEKLLIRNLEELNEFIENLRLGKYKVESVPVAADLLSLSPYVEDVAVQKGLRGDVAFVTQSPTRPIVIERVSLRHTNPKYAAAWEPLKAGGPGQRKGEFRIEFPRPMPSKSQVLVAINSFDARAYIEVTDVAERDFGVRVLTDGGAVLTELDISYIAIGP